VVHAFRHFGAKSGVMQCHDNFNEFDK